jgi:hypothetical protein
MTGDEAAYLETIHDWGWDCWAKPQPGSLCSPRCILRICGCDSRCVAMKIMDVAADIQWESKHFVDI